MDPVVERERTPLPPPVKRNQPPKSAKKGSGALLEQKPKGHFVERAAEPLSARSQRHEITRQRQVSLRRMDMRLKKGSGALWGAKSEGALREAMLLVMRGSPKMIATMLGSAVRKRGAIPARTRLSGHQGKNSPRVVPAQYRSRVVACCVRSVRVVLSWAPSHGGPCYPDSS